MWKRHGLYVVLALLSALIVAPTFEVVRWTGLAWGRELPIGCAVVLAAIWGVSFRLRLGRTLTSSLVGIGTGLWIAKLWHSAELGRFSTGSLVVGPVMVAVLVWLYLRNNAQELAVDAGREQLRRELVELSSPEEAQEFFRKKFADQPSYRLPGFTVGVAVFASVLMAATNFMPGSRPGPVSIALTVGVCCLTALLVWLWAASRRW